MRRTILIGMLAGAVVAALLPIGAQAATPGSGTLSKKSASVSWTGGPFAAPFADPCTEEKATCDTVGTSCPVPGSCESFFLKVDADPLWRVNVVIKTEHMTRDNYNFAVFTSDGQRIGQSISRWGYESLDFEHRPSSGRIVTYEIRVSAPAIVPGSSYDGMASLRRPDKQAKLPPWEPRTEFCPNAIDKADDVPPFTHQSNGQTVYLDILALLDNVDKERAQAIFESAEAAYLPLGIEFRVTYDEVAFHETNRGDFAWEAALHVGGSRPEGIDIVHTLTDQSWGEAEGWVFCIGGIKWDTAAFSFSRTHPQEDVTISPLGVRTYVDSSAIFVAHEMGHLLGGEHQYANCVEGQALAFLGPESRFSPCTVMWFESTPPSLSFSTVNGIIVRALAEGYATP